MQRLVRTQKLNFEQLSRMRRNFKKDSQVRKTNSYLSILRNRVLELQKKHAATHQKILEEIKDEAEYDKPYFAEHFMEFEDMCMELQSEIDELILGMKQDTSVKTVEAQTGEALNVSEDTTRTNNDIRLPRIELPIFDGNYANWLNFKDLFCSLIYNKTHISNVEKLHYLKCSLKGEAANLLSAYTISSNNLDLAWKTLVERYDNPNVIVNAQLRVLVQHDSIPESASAIKGVLDKTTEAVQLLEAMDITNLWHTVVVYLVVKRLPTATRALWEQQQATSNELLSWEDLRKFLHTRFRTLEATSTNNRTSSYSQSPRKIQSHHVQTSIVCAECSQSHKLRACPQFLKAGVNQRYEMARKHRFCLNCLGKGHMATSCPSNSRCFKCKGLHHTMLHKEQTETHTERKEGSFPSTSAQVFVPSNVQTLVGVHALNGYASSAVLLATALVQVNGPRGTVTLRALLDQGSQASLITGDAVQRLKLIKSPCNTMVSGVGSTGCNQAKGVVNAAIVTTNEELIPFRAFVLPKLAKFIPGHYMKPIQHLGIPASELADPQYNIPGRIDLILGAEVYAKLLMSQNAYHNGVLLQQTKLGWVLSGGALREPQNAVQSFSIEVEEQPRVEDLLERFWKMEEPQMQKIIRPEHAECEEFYRKTTTRTAAGKFMVGLPFKSESLKHELGDSKWAAETSFRSLERKFVREPTLKIEYTKCIQEYIDKGFLSPVESTGKSTQTNDSHGSRKYYLPHHAVQKDSSTTSTRIVFDASRKTTSGLSLNDVLHTGPAIQNDLLAVLTRWRMQRYAFSADIAKMYLQIEIRPEDRDYQRILWRFKAEENIQEYRFNTVTFGVTTAPFLAIRTLQQLAEEGREVWPRAAKAIQCDFYVDDVLSGANTKDEAKLKMNELSQLLQSGGFHLRKWISNEPSLLCDIPMEDREITNEVNVMETGHKSLGIMWYPTSDCLSYRYTLSSNAKVFTKRSILSDIARLYDPLGWIAPVTILAKCWMQKIWIRGLNWDEELPCEMNQQWCSLRDSLHEVENIKIPRWVSLEDADELELHGFCDASKQAYGATLYIVSRAKNDTKVQMIMAKTKVAPIKPVTIPRLELCGAVLLSKITKQVLEMFDGHVNFKSLYLWTDSKIVLSWLQSHPSRWNVFVSNRTCQILENVPNIPWRYVQTKSNPADLVSRGVVPHQLLNNDLWWNGPGWLRRSKEHWPSTEDIEPTKEEVNNVMEVSCHHLHLKESVLNELIGKYSTLTRLIRVLSYCRRFCQAVKRCEINQGHLTAQELDASLNMLIVFAQNCEFGSEIRLLKSDLPISKDSKLISLHPFLDGDGILRLSGRLFHANMNFNEKYPIILPKNNNLSKLIIEDLHKTTIHGDIQLMLASLRKKFWILDARNLVKQCIHNCVNCYKTKAQTATQLMGSLPAPRVNRSRPFTHVGVDYCGPISIKDKKGRGARIHKGYIAIFVCLAVKAIHIEVVNDLTTDAFLGSFRRFVSRRGLCTDMYSDMGTNFVGANAEMMRIMKANQRMAEYAENQRINWHFNPPASPHFGGLWEAGVKSMKLHLRKTLGNAILTYEELSTTTTQIEACLNSRPLCQIYDESSEAFALTPAHFLIGDTLLNAPEPNVLDLKESYLSRWQLTQRLAQVFWDHWSKEYLSRLQQRPKWVSQKPEPRIGDICLVQDERYPSYKWPLAKITALHPGHDNLVRVVTVLQNGKLFKRNITKISLLPVNRQ